MPINKIVGGINNMDKLDILIKNYEILKSNPIKNGNALLSAVSQIIEINPQIGIRCWEEVIREHISEISPDFGKDHFMMDTVGYVLVDSFEESICEKRYFVNALDSFARDKYLLEVLYSKSPISQFFSGQYAISYLIRHHRLSEAENILSAIYKNKGFRYFANMWGNIIKYFEYGDEYNPGGYLAVDIKQPPEIQEFCFSWIERIPDEEEKAGAKTFALQIV